MPTAEESIKGLIRGQGRITFAEFMELALYGPGGYYTEGKPTGRQGDYYTSPQAHPAFGALIALHLEQLWALLGRPQPFHAVEAGAGDGTLARDIVAFSRSLDPSFSRALRYIALDRRPPGSTPAPALQWVHAGRFPVRGLVGCVLSNELIDSLPVHRVAMKEGRLREVYVALEGERLVESLDEPSTPEIARRLALEGAHLEEGWEAEVGLSAAAWIEEAARSLTRGCLLTIDYGDVAERLYSPRRARGTVMSYYRHTPQSDPYLRLGRQDITAHANFTTLAQAGLGCGLTLAALITQRQFLQRLGIDCFIEATARLNLPQRERQANGMALRELMKPEGLGGFKVLIQSKSAPTSGLACLAEDGSFKAALQQRLAALPLPLLDNRHLDLMAARYPHLQASWEELLPDPP